MTVTPCKGEHHPHLDHGLDRLLKDVVAAQFAFGKEVIHLVGAGAKAALGELAAKKAGKEEPCCDMPEACWMPKRLGEIECWLRPGCTGEVKLIVTNNDFRPHNVTAQSAGADAGLVAFTPQNVTLGPKERTTILAKFTAPQNHGAYEAVLWVTVCSDHYLRWTVHVGEKEGPCCYEVTVDDNPDYAVHWYDHFYCQKPCMGTHGRNV